MPSLTDKKESPLVGKAPLLLVTKAGTGLPTRGHHIDAFAVCLGFSPLAFVTKAIVARRAAIYNAVTK
jgi:hypothetical protein